MKTVPWLSTRGLVRIFITGFKCQSKKIFIPDFFFILFFFPIFLIPGFPVPGTGAWHVLTPMNRSRNIDGPHYDERWIACQTRDTSRPAGDQHGTSILLDIWQTPSGLLGQRRPLHTSFSPPCDRITIGLLTWIFKSINNGYWNRSHWGATISQQLFITHLKANCVNNLDFQFPFSELRKEELSVDRGDLQPN